MIKLIFLLAAIASKIIVEYNSSVFWLKMFLNVNLLYPEPSMMQEQQYIYSKVPTSNSLLRK